MAGVVPPMVVLAMTVPSPVVPVEVLPVVMVGEITRLEWPNMDTFGHFWIYFSFVQVVMWGWL